MLRTRLSSIVQTKSLDETLKNSNGVSPGFDFMRIALAILIFYSHTKFALTPSTGTINALQEIGNVAEATKSTLYAQSVQFLSDIKSRAYILFVPMFFALSGFLVAGSAFRSRNMKKFFWARSLRIFPALTVEVMLCALVLGLTFSQLSFLEYVSDAGFIRYFGNILGFVTFELPGVFLDNPARGLVNVNLWTLPSEFYCYLATGILMVTGVIWSNRFMIFLFLSSTIVLAPLSYIFGFATSDGVFSTIAVVYSFFCGVIFYIMRARVALSFPVFFVSTVVVLFASLEPRMNFLLVIPLTYMTVFIGSNSMLSFQFLKGRDYSYGIYLYGFPITQSFVAMIPDIQRLPLFFFSFTTTLLFAAASWHLIEKPALSLKFR